jgi:hypothetical protein
VNTPKFTDQHRFLDGYTRSLDTDVAATIERARKRIELARKIEDENRAHDRDRKLVLLRRP